MDRSKHYIPEGYVPRVSVSRFGCADPVPCNVCRDSVLTVYGYEHSTNRDIWVCKNCKNADKALMDNPDKHQIPSGYFPRVSGAMVTCAKPRDCNVCGNSVYTLFGYEHSNRADHPDLWVCDTCRVVNSPGEQEVLNE